MNELDNIVDSLHDYEKKVLSSLTQPTSIAMAVKITGLSEIEVMRGAQWLSNKKIIVINEKKKTIASLTNRGEETLSKGLPEIRMLNSLLKENEQTFDKIKKSAGLDDQEFNKALGFTKKQGFIAIINGAVKIIQLGIDYLKLEERKKELLKVLENGGVDKRELQSFESELKEMEERGLVKVEEKNDKELITTPLGIQLLKHGLELDKKMLEKVDIKLIKGKEWENTPFRRYNIKDDVPKTYFGKKQSYNAFVERIKEKMISLGFREMEGPIVELTFNNCDALYMPQDHPARGIHDMFLIKEPGSASLKGNKFVNKVKKIHEKGWKIKFSKEITSKYMLRSQTTAVSARKMMDKNIEIPGKYFAIGRCYRPDVIDKTHLPEFDQLEGIVLGEELNIKYLFGLLRMFAEQIAKVKKYKLVPGYFPFTEPSVELHVWTGKRWMELGGAGIFREEVTKPLGINVPVIAWGLGFGRGFMTEHNIEDIRQFFSTDIKWLREESA
ncbi:Phenylalanine--tRNA ligase alpha subunit [Candidatus Tiddalikarchaeum anstoanum]|nr:Phenylalanine--tRNA ligase alpha subunit [Candidatus Tiddalikarchaeum anstoanum]